MFLQTDPIGYAGGMNLYAYVGGDPVNLTDAFGLCEGQGTRTPCVPHRVSGVEVDGKRPPPPPDCPTSVDHCVTGPLKGIPTRVQFQPGALRPPRPGSGTRPSKDKKRKAACDAAGYADRLGSGYENIAVGFAGLAEVAGGDSAGPQAAATAPAAVFFSAVAGAYGGGATLAHLFAAGARFYATGNAAQVITTLVGLGVEKASGVKGLSEAADSKADSVISDFITGDPCKDHK